MASANVGCAWIVRTSSSTVHSRRSASVASRHQLRRPRADHVDAQHLIVLLVGDDFHEPFGLAGDLRPPEHDEGKRSHARRRSRAPGFALGQPDAADLGVAIGAGGHVIVVDRTRVVPGHPLGGDDAFGRRHVRQLRVRPAERDHVADGRQARHARAKQRVDGDVAAFDLQAELFDAQSRRHGPAARGDEQVVGAGATARSRRAAALRPRRPRKTRRPWSRACRCGRRCPAS